jgi:two-component system nitrogen regulation response regulator GlnG
MPASELFEGTLPSVEAVLPDQCGEQQLLLTLAFHPDPARIGETVRLPRGRHVLGRDRPGFSLAGQDPARPLLDRHVSRHTLVLDFDGVRLSVERQPGACRCRLGGEDLAAGCELPANDLQHGVSILISHTVLLWVTIAAATEHPPVLPGFGLVGNSPYLQGLRKQIAAAAGSDLDVLLLGPTGSGKDLAARAIHAHSRRRGQPLVAVNLAAVPASLAPAALFGAARGAFTGADRPRPGYFQQAAGGTLFLDEIGDAPAEVQPQLLRALQQREVQVVGGALKTVDLRVIAATDIPVAEATSGFRSALRHRLGALEIRLLPLRHHAGDIGILLWHFLSQSFAREGRLGLLPGSHSSAAELSAWSALFLACLEYDWPGNVRELANLCNQVAVASESRLVAPPVVLERLGRSPSPAVQHDRGDRRVAPAGKTPLRRIVDVSEEEFAQAWRDQVHEVRAVARNLGVSRQAVYRKVAASDCYRLASEVPDAELRSAMRECGDDPHATAQLLEVSLSGLKARLRQGRPAQRG